MTTKDAKAQVLISDILKDLRRLTEVLGFVPSKTQYLEIGKFKEWDLRGKQLTYEDAVNKCRFKEDYLLQEETAPALKLKIERYKADLKRLQGELTETQESALSSDSIKKLIHDTSAHDFGHAADWLVGTKKVKGTYGIPTLFLSDIHFDEIVKPEQIAFCNEYNREIATKRIQYTFQTAVNLLKGHMASPKFDGMVVALGGDLLSGNIHEELAETNEASINQSLLALTDLLITGIGGMADEFGKIFVPCVVGNHGRHHHKPRAKNRVYDNHEWLIYQYIARYFKNDPRVTVMIPEGADAQYSVYGTNFLLTHGDQFKGGTGIAGIFSPLMLGMARKQKRQQAIKKPFDIMMMGHWHQLIMSQHLIVNGSIKGLDEYAYQGNFGYERPQQALFIMHPEKGMTFRMPVLCDGYLSDPKARDQKAVEIVW